MLKPVRLVNFRKNMYVFALYKELIRLALTRRSCRTQHMCKAKELILQQNTILCTLLKYELPSFSYELFPASQYMLT